MSDSPASVTPPSAPTSSPGLGRFLYNSNPFYFLSAMLTLGGLRLAYGEVPVGSLDCWGMFAALAGYTLLMAAAAVAVIRLGRVWDDARSILVTLVLLLVAVSVSFDELLVIAPDEAVALTLAGWTLAVVVTEGVLLLSRIALPACYRVPYHLTMALLFWFPLFVSPELTGLTQQPTHLRLLVFPWLVAAVSLTLLPAIARGRDSVQRNTTPWAWPLFPWSLFVFLGVVCVLRSYVLTLSFGPSDGLESTFGRLHLFPMLLALAVLLLEAGMRHSRLFLRVAGMTIPLTVAALFLLPEPRDRGSAYLFDAVAALAPESIASPVSLLAFVGAAVFYGWALVRRQTGADLLLTLCVVGGTSSLQADAIAPTLGYAGVLLLAIGLVQHSPLRMVGGGAMLCGTLLLAPLPDQLLAYRAILTFHAGVGIFMAASLRTDGWLQQLLAFGAAGLLSLAAAAVTFGLPSPLPTPAAEVYLVALAVVLVGYGLLVSEAEIVATAWIPLGLFAVRLAVRAFDGLADAVGREAAFALVGGAASLVAAGLISTRKAKQPSPSPESSPAV